jgi:hypothetical protein
MAMLVVLNRISRLRAQVKNVGEEVVFVKTGEVKAPKVYDVLFVDRANDLLGPLAQACALQAFPESGQYETAGTDPAGELSSDLGELAREHGITLATAAPRNLAEISDLSRFHVIVVLQPIPAGTLDPPPFLTVRLDWELDPKGGSAGLLQQISGRLSDLLFTLRGDRPQ